jgi:hypothetical protein
MEVQTLRVSFHPSDQKPVRIVGMKTFVRQTNKSIGEKSLNFNELKEQFYNNIKRLKSLDIHDPIYTKLYYENEDILKEAKHLTVG